MADEQVGNNSYLTMTPGSAVAGQLQNILTQRRLEARQDMLDKLNAQNVQSQIADRDQNARTNEAYRQSLADSHTGRMADQEAQEETRRAGLYSPGQPLVGTDLNYWHQRNPSMVVPGQAASTLPNPTDVGPEQPATPETWRGTAAQLETKRKTDAQIKGAQVMASPEYAKMDPAQKAYWYEQATLKSPAPGLITDKSDQSVPIYINGKATGEYGPPNALHFNVPHDPVPPPSTPYELEDEAGNKHLYTLGRDNKSSEVQFGSGLRLLGKAGTAHDTKPPKGIQERTKLGFTAAKGDWLKSPTDAAKIGKLNQMAAFLVNEYPTSDDVKQKIIETYSNPGYRKMFSTLDKFKQSLDPEGDPKKTQDAINLWQLLVQ